MKGLLKNLFCCLCAATAVLYSCSPEEGEQECKIAFAMNPMVVMFDAATYDCGLITDGNWTATTNDSWISLAEASGSPSDKLQVSLELNDGDNDRNGTVKVKAGKTVKSLVICQSGVVGSGFLSKTQLTFDTYSSTQKLFVESEKDWTLSDIEGDWFSCEKVSGSQVSVCSEVNFTGSPRTGSFVVSSTDGSRRAKVTVKQNFSNEKFLASTPYGRKFVYATNGFISSVSSDTYTELADGVAAFEMTCKYKDSFAGDSSPLQRKIFLFFTYMITTGNCFCICYSHTNKQHSIHYHTF